jgi:hypothetical protein
LQALHQATLIFLILLAFDSMFFRAAHLLVVLNIKTSGL